MPTRARAARVLEEGGANRSDPLVRSSLRMAKLRLRKAPIVLPIRPMTIASVIRTATVASEYFRAAVSRRLPPVPLPRAVGCSDLKGKMIKRSVLSPRQVHTDMVNL